MGFLIDGLPVQSLAVGPLDAVVMKRPPRAKTASDLISVTVIMFDTLCV